MSLVTRPPALDPRPGDDPDPLDQYVWDIRYADAPVVRFHDSDTDGNYEDTADNVLYYTQDANFNVTALVDASSGAVVERYLYDPYGAATVLDADWAPVEGNPSAVDNAVLYAGYGLDAESGLYHTDYREYHCTLGRWTRVDPIGPASSWVKPWVRACMRSWTGERRRIGVKQLGGLLQCDTYRDVWLYSRRCWFL